MSLLEEWDISPQELQRAINASSDQRHFLVGWVCAWWGIGTEGAIWYHERLPMQILVRHSEEGR